MRRAIAQRGARSCVTRQAKRVDGKGVHSVLRAAVTSKATRTTHRCIQLVCGAQREQRAGCAHAREHGRGGCHVCQAAHTATPQAHASCEHRHPRTADGSTTAATAAAPTFRSGGGSGSGRLAARCGAHVHATRAAPSSSHCACIRRWWHAGIMQRVLQPRHTRSRATRMTRHTHAVHAGCGGGAIGCAQRAAAHARWRRAAHRTRAVHRLPPAATLLCGQEACASTRARHDRAERVCIPATPRHEARRKCAG